MMKGLDEITRYQVEDFPSSLHLHLFHGDKLGQEQQPLVSHRQQGPVWNIS